jgi:hypothetical protein
MSPMTKKGYKCAVRSFSRILVNTASLQDDIFFSLSKRYGQTMLQDEI